MTNDTFTLSRWKIALAAVAIGLVLVIPAAAQNTVTQVINPGTLSASIADLTMPAVEYSHAAQTSTSTMVLTAEDSSGSGDGWDVTVLASDFTGTGTDSIDAGNFEIMGADPPTMVAGQEVDETGGPHGGVGGTLETERMVLNAAPGFGSGMYTQNLDVSLLIPGQTLADTYTSELTVSMSAGPGEEEDDDDGGWICLPIVGCVLQ